MLCNDIVPVEQARLHDLAVMYDGKTKVLRSVNPTRYCTFFQLLEQVTKAIVDDIITITGDQHTVMIQIFCDLPGSDEVVEIAGDADMKRMFSVHRDDDLILLLVETTVVETLGVFDPHQVYEAV